MGSRASAASEYQSQSQNSKNAEMRQVAAELRITLDKAQEAKLERFLTELSARAGNVNGALKNIGEALLQTAHERFDTGKDPQGKPWQPLSKLTIMLRRSEKPILLRTGRLRNSISYNVVNQRLEVGPNTADAALHQFGGTIVPREKKALRIPGLAGGDMFMKKAVIPARPFIGFGEADEEAARDALYDWLDIDAEAKIS